MPMTDKTSPRPYALRFNNDAANEIFVKIIQKLSLEHVYRNPHYTAAQMARELGTDPRYLSAIVARQTGHNYSHLVNSYRLRDARMLLADPRYANLSAEEVGIMCGYASRQAFYLAFSREEEMTPRQYRMAHGK